MGRVFRIKLGLRRFSRRHPWLMFAVRSFVIFSAAFGGTCGFIIGSRAENSGYDPQTFAVGIGFLFAMSCVALATLSVRLRWMGKRLRGMALDGQTAAEDGAAQGNPGRPQLGIAGGRTARPQPVRIPGRPDRVARRRGL